MRSLLKVILFGGSGGLIIGMFTDKWIQGFLFTISIAIANEYGKVKVREKGTITVNEKVKFK